MSSRAARRIATLLTAGILAAAGSLTAAPARAASNGQQICFTNSTSIGYVIIEGTNQNNDHTTWEGPLYVDWFLGTNKACTDGWWWKGTTTASYCLRSSDSRPCQWFYYVFDVPGAAISDWFFYSVRAY
jgi:hypothetical protein